MTDWRIRLSPRAASVRRALGHSPIGLLVNVIRSFGFFLAMLAAPYPQLLSAGVPKPSTRLELQPALPGRLGGRLHPTMVREPRPIEHDQLQVCLQRAFRDQLADLPRRLGVAGMRH
jgi:hypothetical protein